MSAEIKKTQVNLDGLLEVLGKNLYSTPAVALRELIQNAHDACVRHRLETGDKGQYNIHLETSDSDNTLTISDNGSGLTRNEVDQYLATIGSGYTRVLRQQSGTEEMVGYFGLGFLSAYVVAEKVEVYTTSYQRPTETWLFSSAGGKTFSISPVSGQPVGTRVVLKLKPEFNGLSNAGVVTALIRKYCCMLPVSITLNSSSAPLNDATPPWQGDPTVSLLQRKRQQLDFASLFEPDYEPLGCISLPENELALQGLIWIQDGSSYLSSDSRNVHVFIRNMFITDKEPDLLPRWAGFISAVFESPRFNPTASRESLQEDEYYHQAREFIRETLVTGLRDLVLREPETWKRVLARHNQSLLGAAVCDDRLFEATRRSIKVPTSQGDLTLPQLVKQSGSTLYVKPEMTISSEDMLLAAQGIPVIKGYLYAVTAYCQRYCQQEAIPLRSLGNQSDQSELLQFQDVPDEVSRRLEPLFTSDSTEVSFARFDPSNVPLVYFNNEDAIIKNRLESDDAAKRISSAALSLARLHTSTIEKKKEKTVYINMSNPVIQKLAEPDCKDYALYADIVRCCVTSDTDGEGNNESALQRLNLFSQSLLALMER